MFLVVRIEEKNGVVKRKHCFDLDIAKDPFVCIEIEYIWMEYTGTHGQMSNELYGRIIKDMKDEG